MYEWWYYNVIEPWVYGDWMLNAVGISSLVAMACGVLGCWLYVRRLSMIGDALSHVVLPGLVIAFLWSGERSAGVMLIGAMLAGLSATFLISACQRWVKVKEDAAIGIVFTALFALGVILLTQLPKQLHLDADCVLYGNVLGVTGETMWLMLGVCISVLIGSVVFYRPLTISSFDATFAVAIGLPVVWIQHALMSLLSITVVASFDAVGAILVVALLVTPAATAHMLAERMWVMLLIAAGHGLVSAFFGVYVGVWFGINPAASIVLVGTLMYAGAFVMAPHRGLAARFRQRRRMRALSLEISPG